MTGIDVPPSADHAVDNPWARSAPEVLERLEVSPGRGLDDSTVRDRRRRYGRNRLKPAKGRGALAILLDQFKNLIILLLAAAALVSFLFGQRLEAIAILVAISLNVAIGFFTHPAPGGRAGGASDPGAQDAPQWRLTAFAGASCMGMKPWANAPGVSLLL